jgi:hypothetical protein
VHGDYHCVYVWERCKLDVSYGEDYGHVRPLGLHDGAFDHHVIYLTVVLSLLFLFLKFRLEPLVIMWMVPKDGKLVLCCDSFYCDEGGDGLGSDF